MAARNVLVAGIALAVTGLATGCGGDAKPSAAPVTSLHGPVLAAQVAAALAGVRSAHFHGTVVAGAAPGEAGVPATMDMVVTQAAGSGVITTVKPTSKMLIIDVGGRIYTKMDAAAAKAGGGSPSGAVGADSTFPDALTDRWVYSPDYSASTSPDGAMSVTETTTSALGHRSLHGMADSLRGPTGLGSPILDTVGSAELDHHSCHVISLQDGTKIYVDRDTLLPVRYTTAAKSTDGASDLSLDGYNAPVSITAPAGAVSMESLFH